MAVKADPARANGQPRLPIALKRIRRSRKVVTVNPSTSRIKAYPRSEARTKMSFLKSTPDHIPSSFRLIFTLMACMESIKIQREQSDKTIPRRKGIKPGPGFARVPSFSLLDPTATAIPSPSQIRAGIRSFCFIDRSARYCLFINLHNHSHADRNIQRRLAHPYSKSSRVISKKLE